MRLARRALLAVPAMALARSAHAAEPAAAAPIARLDEALVAAMKAGPSTPFRQRFDALRPVVERAFDLPSVLRASIGPRFAALPPPQQAALLDVFGQFTVATYAANFNTYGGEQLRVLPAQRTVGPDVVVQTEIVPARGEPVSIDYVMRRFGSDWRAVDVLLDGSISQNAVKRSDFRSLVSAASAQPLIDSLRRKVGELSGGTLP